MKLLSPTLAILLSLLFSTFAGARETKIPLPWVGYGKGHETLLVLLPGKGDRMWAFERKGFIDVLRRSGLAADIIAVDATYDYYENGTVLERLHNDIILPARRNGYASIAILGISMGGTGALLYGLNHPELADVIVAFSPYLGDDTLISEIMDAGGLDRWEHIRVKDGKNTLATPYLREFFGWLKNAPPEDKEGRIYLCYGNQDRFAAANSILEGELPEDQTLIVKGGHNWKTWKKLLGQLLMNDDFRMRLERNQTFSGLGSRRKTTNAPLPPSFAGAGENSATADLPSLRSHAATAP